MTVVFLNRSYQVLCGNTDLLSQLLQRICLVSPACSYQIVDGLVEVVHLVAGGIAVAVHDDVHQGIRLLEQCQGHLIPASALVDEPVAFLVDEDTALYSMFDVAGQASGLRIA